MATVQEKVLSIIEDRNTIAQKLAKLGLGDGTDNLDACAKKIDNIINRGSPAGTVTEGGQYNIEPGYYSGGSVTGIPGGGDYSVGPVEVTPAKEDIVKTAKSEGFYGFSQVTVKAIPKEYQLVTPVTATQDDVVSPKIFVDSEGRALPGNIQRIGDISVKLDTSKTSHDVEHGLHTGGGKVSIELEEKSVTPEKVQKTVTPTTGKVLSKVTVDPIPDNFIDTTVENGATPEGMTKDSQAWVNGKLVVGTAENNGNVSQELDALAEEEIVIPPGFTSGGTIKISSTLAEALALI